MAAVSHYNNYEDFSWQSHFYPNAQTRKFFMIHVGLFITTQKIRLISPKRGETQVHNVSPNHGGGGKIYI